MAVGRTYMLRKPGDPSTPRLFLDTRVVPLVVTMAGEVASERASMRTGVRPVWRLGGLTGILLRLLRIPRAAADT